MSTGFSFGSKQSTPAFGQGGFGAQPTGSITFGTPVATSTTTPSLFGASAQSQNLFGTPGKTSNLGFGTTPALNTGLGFGTASAPGTGLGFGAPNVTAPSSGLSFGTPSANTGLGFGSAAPTGTGFGFGTSASSAPSTGFFGAPPSVAPSTGLSFGGPTAAAPTGLSFGVAPTPAPTGLSFGVATVTSAPTVPFATPASTGLSFGAAPPTANTGLSFGTPAPTGLTFGTPTATAASTGLGFSGTSGVSFGAPATTSAPSLGLSFGTATTSAAPGFSFGTPAAAPSAGLGFSLAPTTTQPSGVPFALGTSTAQPSGLSLGPGTGTTQPSGLPFGLGATTTQSSGLSFGLGTSTTQPSTLSFGLGPTLTQPAGLSFGLGLSGTAANLNLANKPTTTTTAPPVGLGGIVTSSPKTTTATSKTDVAPKDQPLPNEILQTVENFKTFVKQQKGYSSDVARCNVKEYKRVAADINEVTSLLNDVEKHLQQNRAIAKKLKFDSAKCLQHVEMAQRTFDTPQNLQYDNTAPLNFFVELLDSFDRDMQNLKLQIENTDKYVKNLGNNESLNSQDLSTGMRRLHETFVALAGRLQSIHGQVQSQKEHYLNFRRYMLHDETNVFEKSNPQENALKIALNSINYKPPQISAGPTPFGSSVHPSVVQAAMQNQTSSTSGISSLAATAQAPPTFGTQTTTQNLFGNTSGFGQPSSQFSSPSANFQLQKPPVGNKRGKQ